MNVELEYESFQDFANRLWPCLSEEGMWVPFDRPAGVGELVDFDVMLADGFRLFHGAGQIIGVGPGPEGTGLGPGITIRFSQLDDPSQNLISKVVRKHAGEGGRPFVLAAPATKVEVVGDDGGEGSASLGPEDLVAPFPDLEGDAEWARSDEPELTSFLRPSGRQTEMELESDSGGLPDLDFRAEPPAEAEPEVVPPPVLELEHEPEPPPEMSVGPEIETAAGEPAEADSVEDLAEEPAFEPMDLDEETPEVEPPLTFTQEIEPLPSTVMPPGESAPVEMHDEEPESFDDELFTQEPATSNGTKWLWALAIAALLAVGYLVLPGFFGGSSEGPDAVDEGELAVAAAPDYEPQTFDAADPADDGATFDAVDVMAGEETDPTEFEDPSDSSEPSSATEDRAGDATVPLGAPVPSSAPRADTTAREPIEPAPTPPPVDPTPAPAAADPAPAVADRPLGDELRLRRITWSERDGDTVIRLALDRAPEADRLSTLRVSQGAPRQVLKIAGFAASIPRAPAAIGSEHVERLRFGLHPVPGGRELHVVADLTDGLVAMVGDVVVDGDALELRFSRPAG